MTQPRTVIVREADQAGDLGWVVMSHGQEYERLLGWNTDFEALVARIVADFAAGHDATREKAWIAEVDGKRVGCIALVATDDPGVAKLRLLLVSSAARGLGVGTRLVDECLAFARAAGYASVTLWTIASLTAARKMYERLGFELVAAREQHSFGHPAISEDWPLTFSDSHGRQTV